MVFVSSAGGRAVGSNAVRGFARHGVGVRERRPVLRWRRCQSLDYTPAAERWRMVMIRCQWRCRCTPRTRTSPVYRIGSSSISTMPRSLDRSDSWTQLIAEHTASPQRGASASPHPDPRGGPRPWPGVPVITHLHGTELKMLMSVQDGTIPDRPGRFSRHWVERMQRWAGDSDRWWSSPPTTINLPWSFHDVEPGCVTTIANGVDTETFSPAARSTGERLAQGSVGSSMILVAGGRVAPRARSRRPRDLAAFTDRPGSRYRWSCSPVASCGSSGCSC